MRPLVLVAALAAGPLSFPSQSSPASAATHPHLVKDIDPGRFSSLPMGMAGLHGKVFFEAFDFAHGYELWKSDGSPGRHRDGSESGTVLVKDINHGSHNSIPDQLTSLKGTLFFSADDGRHGVELWKSNGKAGGTKLVADINAGSGGSIPAILTAVGGKLFFSAFDRHHGRELWVCC